MTERQESHGRITHAADQRAASLINTFKAFLDMLSPADRAAAVRVIEIDIQLATIEGFQIGVDVAGKMWERGLKGAEE
jgi:hypothetical protein